MGSFQVLFSGDLVRGAEQSVVQARLAAELGIDDRKARQLFQGRTVVLRSHLAEQDALTLQHRLFELGAVCRVKDTGAPSRDRTLNQLDRDAARFEQKWERTMRDITAAFVECPRCAELQLESSHCARCGVDMAAAAAQKRREDELIEQQIRALRAQRAAHARAGKADGGEVAAVPGRPGRPLES